METLLAEGPAAAREAARAGSHRQALAHFEAVVPHADRLELAERASFLNDYAWELYNAHRFRAAVNTSHAAERLYRELGAPVPLAMCLVRLSRHLFMTGATDAAEEAAQRAVVTLLDARDEPALAYATLYLGGILAQTRPEFAAEVLERADALALRSRLPELAALCLNYLAIVRVEAGEPDGLQTMRNRSRWRRRARTTRRPRAATATWPSCCCGWGGSTSSSAACARAWTSRASAGSGRTPTTSRCTAACCCCGAGTGIPPQAGLRKLLEDVSDPGMLFAYSAPWLGRLLARRGDRSAGKLIADAWQHAQSGRLRIGLAYAGIARAEWAWLTGDVDAAREVAAVMLPRMENPGAAPFRGELLRYLEARGARRRAVRGLPAGVGRGPARRLARRGGGLAARRRPVRDRARADGGRRRVVRRGGRSRSSAWGRPRSCRSPATACAPSASPSRAARAPPPARTRRASRPARSRCSNCCARA